MRWFYESEPEYIARRRKELAIEEAQRQMFQRDPFKTWDSVEERKQMLYETAFNNFIGINGKQHVLFIVDDPMDSEVSDKLDESLFLTNNTINLNQNN